MRPDEHRAHPFSVLLAVVGLARFRGVGRKKELRPQPWGRRGVNVLLKLGPAHAREKVSQTGSGVKSQWSDEHSRSGYRSVMRIAICLVVVMSLSACVRPYITLPRTRAAMSCRRECMMVENSCRMRSRSLGNSVRCTDQVDECLLTCPGAQWSDEIDQPR